MDARPQPGLPPGEKGKRTLRFGITHGGDGAFTDRNRKAQGWLPPLRGERAGVREDVTLNDLGIARAGRAGRPMIFSAVRRGAMRNDLVYLTGMATVFPSVFEIEYSLPSLP